MMPAAVRGLHQWEGKLRCCWEEVEGQQKFWRYLCNLGTYGRDQCEAEIQNFAKL